ncbi:hypothetical protein FITA111629_08815 [Filibacter tadaridae]|uniref:Uncharacterized protein n=1 Tax=Filibacter tadaridae TaxID=2483811 RepID=A0A3P5WJC5_9BACL|nr:hypothetical protein FILTAD_00599 [Filibacter tadaridae]
MRYHFLGNTAEKRPTRKLLAFQINFQRNGGYLTLKNTHKFCRLYLKRVIVYRIKYGKLNVYIYLKRELI